MDCETNGVDECAAANWFRLQLPWQIHFLRCLLFMCVDMPTDPVKTPRIPSCRSPLALAFALIPSLALAQSYTTDPNFTINDQSTVYDGIGTVTPLQGGTSVLERVLHAVEQINLSSPGAMAPVNGIYSNIAESVLDRQWYSTDRTEIAYEDYQEDVVTPTSAPIDFSLFENLQGDGEITLADGTTVNILDVPIGTIRVWELYDPVGNRVPTFLTSAYFEGTTTEYTFTARDLGTYFTAPYDGSVGYPFYFRLNPDGSIELYDDGPTGFIRTVSEIAIAVTIDGQEYRFDSVGGAEATTPWDYTTDYFGTWKTPSGRIPIPEFTTLKLTLDGEGNPAFVFSDTAPEDTVYLDYGWEEIVTTDFTRQLNSLYEDWWQRDVSTLIDGSITNIVTGVNEITQTAMAGANALEYTLPTLDFGNIATTALGAVNTGDITVGVNSAVDDAATATTSAVRSTLTVVGGHRHYDAERRAQYLCHHGERRQRPDRRQRIGRQHQHDRSGGGEHRHDHQRRECRCHGDCGNRRVIANGARCLPGAPGFGTGRVPGRMPRSRQRARQSGPQAQYRRPHCAWPSCSP